jgi:hypothetical protein
MRFDVPPLKEGEWVQGEAPRRATGRTLGIETRQIPMRTVALVSVVVVLLLGTWPMVDFASGQPPGYACPYGYYYATDGYCYPTQQPAYVYYPPPVYEYAPPVYQPPVAYDGYGIGLGSGLRPGGAERGHDDHDRGRGEREHGHR